jgi:hypothetical protein
MNMNHTTLGIVAVIAAAALVAGAFAVISQAALAGRGGDPGRGDSVSFKQSNQQKAKCLALVISRAGACNQDAENEFDVS